MRYENEAVGKGAVQQPESVKIKDPGKEKDSTLMKTLLLLRDIGITIAILIIILQFFKPTVIFEHSMEDTLHPKDYVFLYKQAYSFGGIVNYGDIIVFKSNLLDDNGVQKSLIKRVIGLPGDTIEIKDDIVYRNGLPLDEPYVKGGATPGDLASLRVPANSYFVMGDNRPVSMDSRTSEVGFVPFDKIEGKVVFRLFPLSSAGAVR